MSKSESRGYNPAAVERRIFEFWEKGGYFHAQPDARPRDRRFCMVIPPPNVTGALHLGHALNNTLQDVLVRRKRMQGFNTLWVVGTDHAGIATQAVVEKTIRKEEGKSRHDLGREELVRRIWEWKEKYGSRIVEQLKLMGCSCDYARERFTLDDGCAKAVRETFFKMFRDGLIYRGKRLVNWDTQLQTAVADDEVYHEAVKGHFYHFKYPVKGTGNREQGTEPQFVQIATTRPETMLADTAVAVHPQPDTALNTAEKEGREKLAEAAEKEKAEIQARIDDIAERRRTLLPILLKLRDMARADRKILLPLVNREIPLICDEWADPTLGTGCVKITPGHDPNDYEVYKRHPEIGIVNVMTPDGRVNEQGGQYKGLKFEDARKKVVADLEALGLVEKIEDRTIDLGHSDRSKTPIEPYLSDQWFVRMGDLEPEHAARVEGLRQRASGFAQMAIDAVKRGDVTFHPARYEKTYTDWLGEKRDWCISRQLWWGHRIPVWQAEASPNAINALMAGSGEFDSVGHERLTIRNELRNHVAIEVIHAGYDDKGNARPHLMVCVAPGYPRFEDELENLGFKQDPDVLDTWFSSALWPHSTLGWSDGAGQSEQRPSGSGELSNQRALSSERQPLPHGRGSDQDSVLEYFYPTSVLSTAREIITLWVARMVMTGLYNIGDVPFKDVVIHPVIQDGQGRKMSKTLGNGVDPVDIIDKYGADALRFTLAELATETQDIRMPVKAEKQPDGRTINTSEKFEKGRNFCNKLWQASTGFVFSNLEGYAPAPIDPSRQARMRLEDRWILSRLAACTGDVSRALDNYRFSEAAAGVYRFMWDEYCSWYIEMSKARLSGEDRGRCQQVLVHVLDQLLRLLHPFVPFVTEALWEQLNAAAPRRGLHTIIEGEQALVAAAWPTADEALRDPAVEAQMELMQSVIRGIRDIRMTVNDYRGRARQPALKTVPSAIISAPVSDTRMLETNRDFLLRLAGCDAVEIATNATKPAGAMSRLAGSVQVFVPVADFVDLAEVRRDVETKRDELKGVLAREQARLSNEGFVSRADPAVVEQARQRAADLEAQVNMLSEQLSSMQ